MSEVEHDKSLASHHHHHHGSKPLVKLISFGYKKNSIPHSNLMLDVRFLKNPYWVEELRPLTGRDERVKRYVMDQTQAKDFVRNLLRLIEQFVPAMLSIKTNTVTIAIGCTGGQHRSVAVAEALAKQLAEDYPDYDVTVFHRELDIECETPATASVGDHRTAVEGGQK